MPKWHNIAACRSFFVPGWSPWTFVKCERAIRDSYMRCSTHLYIFLSYSCCPHNHTELEGQTYHHHTQDIGQIHRHEQRSAFVRRATDVEKNSESYKCGKSASAIRRMFFFQTFCKQASKQENKRRNNLKYIHILSYGFFPRFLHSCWFFPRSYSIRLLFLVFCSCPSVFWVLCRKVILQKHILQTADKEECLRFSYQSKRTDCSIF